eukprot:scaffold1137_cov85-Skeletonema_dohrnii-CCMP3373.AAC.1
MPFSLALRAYSGTYSETTTASSSEEAAATWIWITSLALFIILIDPISNAEPIDMIVFCFATPPARLTPSNSLRL